MSSLRSYLQRIDGSAPGIQGAAGAMMKHYDKSPGVAVQEWRNALIQAQSSQYLPLLYVANEVLQTSKRNRGNKFLEAFSPILGQSLIFVCSKSDAPTVDRVRRTVKIWAERRVFSIRYVNELIKGLEPYRNGNNRSPSPTKQQQFVQTPGGGRFSPVQQQDEPEEDDDDGDTSMFGDDNDAGNASSSDDDADDLFGNASKKLLNISVDIDQTTIGTTKKRPRSSQDDAIPGITTTTNNNNKSPKAKRRASAQYLSVTGLLDLMNQVATQQSNYERTLLKLQTLRSKYNTQDSRIESLVGNELLQEYKKLLTHEQEMDRCRNDLHSIAQTRKELETQAMLYLPWLERALQQDRDDVLFCQKFQAQLERFAVVHGPTKEARTKRLQQEALQQQKERELAAQKLEEEERKKFADAAMFRQTEAKEGMVWNKATGEYQYPNQEESWRD